MKSNRAFFAFALALALAGAAAGTFARAATPSPLDDKVKLTGCVVKGEGDGAGYLLTNSPVEPALQSGALETHSAPGAVGTSGNFANVFYWLDGDRGLKKNIGHQVEIEGHAKGDVKEGELKVDRKDKWTEMTVRSDGRTMKARVPNTSVVPAKDADHKVSVLVRKVDVDMVRMIGASCQ